MQSIQTAIHNEQQYVVQTYVRPDFVLVRGEGIMLYDDSGRAYQDWVAGIAVNALGYNDPGITDAIQTQLATGVLHVSNLYHTEPHAELAKKLCETSFADRVFFCNSGAEANEGAIKFARRVAYSKGHTDKTQIVTFSSAFHGRTMGALAVTPRDKYQKPFKPLMPDVVTAEFNHIESARTAITDQTAAVIVEPVQGEGGIYPADPDFLQALRQFCDEHDALLMFDEVQCGMGRTGTLWAHEAAGVTPDILAAAKPLAAGLPIGAVLVTEAVAQYLKPGDHASTFAGGPVVTAVAGYVLDRISDPQLLAHVREVGAYLMDGLEALDSPLITGVRGRGLMVAAQLSIEAAPVIEAGYEHGLLLVNAGTDVLRFVPPLIVTKEDVDSMLDTLGEILEQFA